MRRLILSIAAVAAIGTSLFAASPAKADWGFNGRPYYAYDNGWRAHEWREHQYWAWRRHMWHEWREHHGYWYR